MTTGAIYRPPVDFFTVRCFSVDYGSKNTSLKCWQKVLIVALGILLVGIGGLALSYYWRERLVQHLYEADYVRAKEAAVNQVQSVFKADSEIPSKIEKMRGEIEKGGPYRMNNQTLAQLSGNGRYFMAINPGLPENLQIPFFRDSLPEGVYCMFSAATSRWKDRIGQDGWQHYRQLCETFGKNKVHMLGINQNRVIPSDWTLRSNRQTDPEWYPEMILVLTADNAINQEQIAEFSSCVSQGS